MQIEISIRVGFDEPEDVGFFVRFAREEPAGYVGMAMHPGGFSKKCL